LDLSCDVFPLGDTILYSSVSQSEETGDYSGTELTFVLTDSGLEGSARVAVGGFLPPVPLQDVEWNSDSGVIRFWYARPITESEFHFDDVTVDCRRIAGPVRRFVTPDNPMGQVAQVDLERLLHPSSD
jgi:hypothetical protein